MSQKLILPLNNCQVLCGYKNEAYQKAWGFTHYGMDLYDPSLIHWAMGDGEVIAAGTDSIFGNCAVVLYKDVYIHSTGETRDLIARCYHMADVPLVKKGDKVTTKTRIGTIGTTGKYSSGVHLHVEFDTDTAHPMMVPGLSGNTSMFQKGVDTTINPAGVLYVKPSAPDNQSVIPNESYLSRGFIVENDYTLPTFEESSQTDYKALYEKTLADYKACYEYSAALEKEFNKFVSDIKALVEKYTK